MKVKLCDLSYMHHSQLSSVNTDGRGLIGGRSHSSLVLQKFFTYLLELYFMAVCIG